MHVRVLFFYLRQRVQSERRTGTYTLLDSCSFIGQLAMKTEVSINPGFVWALLLHPDSDILVLITLFSDCFLFFRFWGNISLTCCPWQKFYWGLLIHLSVHMPVLCTSYHLFHLTFTVSRYWIKFFLQFAHTPTQKLHGLYLEHFLSQAGIAWLSLLINHFSHTLLQLSINRGTCRA